MQPLLPLPNLGKRERELELRDIKGLIRGRQLSDYDSFQQEELQELKRYVLTARPKELYWLFWKVMRARKMVNKETHYTFEQLFQVDKKARPAFVQENKDVPAEMLKMMEQMDLANADTNVTNEGEILQSDEELEETKEAPTTTADKKLAFQNKSSCNKSPKYGKLSQTEILHFFCLMISEGTDQTA